MKLKKNMTVLICDDHESDIEKLKHILDYSYGFAVRTVAFRQASDALRYIKSGAEVDVCFLETVTQELDGVKLAEQLRASGYADGIVFLTESKSYGPDSFRVNALDYLMKPIMPDKVRGAINKAEKRRGAVCAQ